MSVCINIFQFFRFLIEILFYLKVIVEKDNQIYLYCKGGDTKIKERLENNQTDLINQTDEHLNVNFKAFTFFI